MAQVGRYIVMRYATVIGYSNGRKIVTVAGRRSSLDDAITLAMWIRHSQLSNRTYPQAAYWIAEVGKPAHGPRARET